MCVVCGSFGLGAEGRLLACAQCGQCYHPFCVGIKVQLLWSSFCAHTHTVYSERCPPMYATQACMWMSHWCFHRSPRWCWVKVGVVWSVQCARPAARPRILAACCCVTTVTSAITPTAWTLRCKTFPRTAGNANGKWWKIISAELASNRQSFECFNQFVFSLLKELRNGSSNLPQSTSSRSITTYLCNTFSPLCLKVCPFFNTYKGMQSKSFLVFTPRGSTNLQDSLFSKFQMSKKYS